MLECFGKVASSCVNVYVYFCVFIVLLCVFVFSVLLSFFFLLILCLLV